MEFKIGTGLACVAIAVAIGQWLIPPNTISYDVRFFIVIGAPALFIVGVGLLGHATWQWYRAPHEVMPSQDLSAPAQNSTELEEKSVQLTVEYDEGRGSFYQESPIHRPGLGKGILQLYRIRVRSLLPVNDVQVKVQSVIPEQRDLHGLPCHVQRMNDNVQPFSRSTTFTKGQEEYFDIAGYAKFMLQTGDLHLRRIDGAAGHIAEEPCNLLVRVTGMGIDPIDRWFRLEIDRNNNLHMSLLQQCPGNASETSEFISIKDAKAGREPLQTLLPKEFAYDPGKDRHVEEMYFQAGFNPVLPTVEILFDDSAIGQRYFTWEMETENGKQVNVQRYSVLLQNTSDQDLNNVTVKLEDVVEESGVEATYLGYELPLDSKSTTIRKKDKAWVRVISYRKQDGPYWISIEGADKDAASKEGKLFRPHNRRELHLMVRADGGIVLPARFQCWVDNQGCLIMKQLNIDAPNSSM